MATESLPEELEDILRKHKEKLDAIVNSFTKKIVSEFVPSRIYHYTNDCGLRGILKTGRLWFTDIFKFNDPSELNHGIEQASRILERKTKEGPKEAKFFSEMFSKAIVAHIKESAHYLVCCFSTDRDDLGQWRAYADDGRGYAIGFDAGILEEAFAKSEPPGTPAFRTFRITYNDNELSEINEKLVAVTIPIVSTPATIIMTEKEAKLFIIRLGSQLATRSVEASLYFKNEAYKYEVEYRFLQIFQFDAPFTDFEIRFQPYSLIRYREFDWKSTVPDSIREIVVGPASDPMIGCKFASDCRRLYLPDAENISIEQSRIPYRSVQK